MALGPAFVADLADLCEQPRPRLSSRGPWDEEASYVEFMGYTQPWYSVRDVDAPVGGEMGHIACFLRDGDRVFLTYSTTGRGNAVGEGVGHAGAAYRRGGGADLGWPR